MVYVGMGQNLIPLVNPKIAGKWMFIPLKKVLIGIDQYPCGFWGVYNWISLERLTTDSLYLPQKPWFCGGFTPIWDQHGGVFHIGGMGV